MINVILINFGQCYIISSSNKKEIEMKTYGIVFADNPEFLLSEVKANSLDGAINLFANNIMDDSCYNKEWTIYHVGDIPYIVTDTLNLITAFEY